MSSTYRVFADAQGFFGEEGLGWGDRRPAATLFFEVDNGIVGDLDEMVAHAPLEQKLSVKEARKALQSWL